MEEDYKKLQVLRARKGWQRSKPFFIEASVAIRNRDQALGLLLQHQQKLRAGGAKKQGASFFVKQEDIASFIILIRRFFESHADKFGRGYGYNITRALSDQNGININNAITEYEKFEEQLNQFASQHEEKVAELLNKIATKDKQIVSLTSKLDELRRQRQRVRIKEMERSVPRFKRKLAELKRLLEKGKEISKKQGKQQESLFQDFLKENFWMFGPQYISVEAKPKSGKRTIPDLLIQRTDGFNDVVELENPTDDLFVKTEKRAELSGELKESLAQVMDYLDDYALGHRDTFYEDNLDTYKPKGIIVIGRRGDRALERRRRQLNSYLHGIEIWTYDDLVSNAQQVIDLLQRGPSKAA